MNPIDNLYCAVTRSTLKGSPSFHPEECVDIYDAVDAYTTESAYATFEEDIKGRLLPGYYADLVVLSENIFELPPTELRRAKVDATWTAASSSSARTPDRHILNAGRPMAARLILSFGTASRDVLRSGFFDP